MCIRDRIIGALLGSALPFDTTGIDFSMTALFVTIFIDQWRAEKSHFPAVTALISGILYLLLLGPDRFLLPAIGTTVCILFLSRGRIKNMETEVQS